MHMEGDRSISFTNSDWEKLQPLMTIQGFPHFVAVCHSGLEQKHGGAREDLHNLPCPPAIRRADIKDHRPLRQSRLQQLKNAYILFELFHAAIVAVHYPKKMFQTIEIGASDG